MIGSPAGIVAGLLLCTASCGPGEEVRAAGVPGEANSGFVPVIVGVEFTQSAVRPGDAFAVTLRFQNEGAAPATKAHTAFVHFEPEPADCSNIAFQADHAPTVPTDTWAPGATITDAPIVVRVPVDARAGTYWVHAGLYDREGDLGRLLDVFPSTLEVSESAPPSTAWRPAPLPEEELLLRRAAFERRLAAPVTLKTDAYSFALDAESAAFLLTDERSGVVWGSHPGSGRFGLVRLAYGLGRKEVAIDRFESVTLEDGVLVARARIEVEDASDALVLTLTARPIEDGTGLRLECAASGADPWEVAFVTLLDHAFTTTDADGGYVLVPRWLGELVPADRGLPADRVHGADELSMLMSGAVKQGSALLVDWSSPDSALVTHATLEDSPIVAGRRAQSLSLRINGAQGTVDVYPLGRGGYVEIAAAYRKLAREREYRVTWAEKRSRHPAVERLEGAALFRFTALRRLEPGEPDNPGKTELIERRTTFEDIALCAEHWRRELGIDRASVLVDGWIRADDDDGRPDVLLHANEECGGDEELARCSAAVRELGYVFGLQGQPYRECSTCELSFAHRHQPVVRETFRPDAWFIGPTLMPLADCTNPEHSLTLQADRFLKETLLRWTREQFGIVGLGGSREWAVPFANWFEGALSQRTLRSPGLAVVPLFPMVYGDCLALFTAPADRIGIADASKVLDHLLYGAMPSYAFGPGRYFEDGADDRVPVRPSIARFDPVAGLRVRIAYAWDVLDDVTEDFAVLVHFVDPLAPEEHGVVARDGFYPGRPTSEWRRGERVVSALRDIRLPAEWSGDRPLEVRVSLVRDGRRAQLEGPGEDGTLRYSVGRLEQRGGRLELEGAHGRAATRVFARADGGWAEQLAPTDRMIKNTWEVLSPLHRLVVDRVMTGHRFLDADRTVEATSFGDVEIVANYGTQPFEVNGARLPQFGFLVTSPTFVAFHATRFADVEYEGGALFTLRSLDGEPLAESGRVRVFHGFGSPLVRLGAAVVSVDREAVFGGE